MVLLLRRAALGVGAAIAGTGTSLAFALQQPGPPRSALSPRPVVYYVASSLDGFIAGEGDDLSWLGGREDAVLAGANGELAEIDFGGFYAGVEYTVSGSRTYDWVRAQGVDDPYPTSTNYVLTSRAREREPDPRAIFADEPAAELVRRLRVAEGAPGRARGAVWIVGGGRLATQLLRAGLVDTLEVSVHPVLLGRGAPLVSAELGEARVDLRMREAVPIKNGVLRVVYDVVHAG